MFPSFLLLLKHVIEKFQFHNFIYVSLACLALEPSFNLESTPKPKDDGSPQTQNPIPKMGDKTLVTPVVTPTPQIYCKKTNCSKVYKARGTMLAHMRKHHQDLTKIQSPLGSFQSSNSATVLQFDEADAATQGNSSGAVNNRTNELRSMAGAAVSLLRWAGLRAGGRWLVQGFRVQKIQYPGLVVLWNCDKCPLYKICHFFRKASH